MRVCFQSPVPGCAFQNSLNICTQGKCIACAKTVYIERQHSSAAWQEREREARVETATRTLGDGKAVQCSLAIYRTKTYVKSGRKVEQEVFKRERSMMVQARR